MYHQIAEEKYGTIPVLSVALRLQGTQRTRHRHAQQVADTGSDETRALWMSHLRGILQPWCLLGPERRIGFAAVGGGGVAAAAYRSGGRRRQLAAAAGGGES